MRSSRRLAGSRLRQVVLAMACAAVGVPWMSGPARADDAPAEGRKERHLPFIDAMLKASWDDAGIKPSPLASDEEYLRRVYLDMLGRIPSLKEAQAFLGSRDKGKRQKLVEYLFEHPDYAKNLGNVWTVLLVGRQRQEREVDRAALSSWLRRQFLDNRAWDRVVYDLVTAKGSNKENGAVNFTLAHMEGGAVPLTSVTSRVFLGLQIQCTQCHDHPTNDWKQADFWSLNAFYKGIRRENVNKADATGADVYDHTELRDEPTDAFSQYDRRNGLVAIAFPRYLNGGKVAQGKEIVRRTELGKLLADPKNPDLAKAFVNRMWGHFMGRGIVHPVDDFGPHNPPSHPELLNRLGEEFQKSGYDARALIRWITSSQAYNLTSVSTRSNDKDESLFSHMTLKPMTPEQLFDSLLTATSAHKAGGDDASGRRRDQWLRQFVVTFANDEGGENTTFQGTIPQALEMMNGELMAQATGGRPGSFLAELLDESRSQGRTAPFVYMVDNLYLAALSRHPSRAEMTNASRYLGSFPDTIEVLQDLFWALLNSNEFALNR